MSLKNRKAGVEFAKKHLKTNWTLLEKHPMDRWDTDLLVPEWLKHIFIASFQLHCGGVQSQNDSNCVNVSIYMDLTVYFVCILSPLLLLVPCPHPSRVLRCDSLRSTPSFYYSNYTLTLHCTFLPSGDIKYDLQSRQRQAKEDRNPQQCIRYISARCSSCYNHLLRDILFLWRAKCSTKASVHE